MLTLVTLGYATRSGRDESGATPRVSPATPPVQKVRFVLVHDAFSLDALKMLNFCQAGHQWQGIPQWVGTLSPPTPERGDKGFCVKLKADPVNSPKNIPAH